MALRELTECAVGRSFRAVTHFFCQYLVKSPPSLRALHERLQPQWPEILTRRALSSHTSPSC